MTKIAHRWSPVLQKVNQRRKEADLFKARLQMPIPTSGVVTCVKKNPHGFIPGSKYLFQNSDCYDRGHYRRILVEGDAQRGIWDWIFIGNDVEFHTYFSLV